MDSDCAKRAADQLNEVTLAMDSVNLNQLQDRDAYRFLGMKLWLHETTLRYREDQHGGGRVGDRP